ncbi:MAG: DUF1549 domain-containing protein [Planctomycetota bacterium]|nr:DUF1549 domain-containing protein [Planctomycetota bacterium]
MRTAIQSVLCLLVLSGFAATVSAQTDPTSLSGLTIDDVEAKLTGEWKSSTSSKPYLGKSYLHDAAVGKGEKSAKFTFRVPVAGDYHVLVAYTSNNNRAPKVPVTITSADGTSTVFIDQQQSPELGTGFQSVGQFAFSDTADASVLIETKETTQHVIVDGIRLLSIAEFKTALKDEKQARPATVVVQKPKSKQPAKPKPKPPEFVRRPAKSQFERLSPQQLDALLNGMDTPEAKPVDDVTFLRRVSLDLVGRQPTLEEYHEFLANKSPQRREQAIDRLLASESFGKNWGNYWSDVIAARQPEPQLTYLNYESFRGWLGKEINAGTGWDEIVFRMLTPIGLVGDGPQGAFIGFHQGERNNLAGETSRVFLGVKIACAQCHDHPFLDMPQTTFHGMAAFFARTSVKLPWNDSDGIEISSSTKGEHKMPGAKSEMAPTVYRGEALDLGLSDLERREQLAYWVVSGDNPFFARSFVNHIQARLMGRGFFHPVDDLGESATPLNPEAHDSLAGHFLATGFGVKALFRLLVSTRTYQSNRQPDSPSSGFTGATPKKLRGDELFDSLVTAIELPNIDQQVAASTDKTRFPPPAKSTRDLVNEAFGFDPSTKDVLLTRTMKQAIFMMNNDQLHRQIDAKADSGTVLARLLKAESENALVIEVLYARVLSRSPTDAERAIVIKHVELIDDRNEAFEDVLWSLLNSAEFTTRN